MSMLMYQSHVAIEQLALTSPLDQLRVWVANNIPKVFQPSCFWQALMQYFLPYLNNQEAPLRLKIFTLMVLRQIFLSQECFFTTESLRQVMAILEEANRNRDLKPWIHDAVEAVREQIFTRRDSELILQYRRLAG